MTARSVSRVVVVPVVCAILLAAGCRAKPPAGSRGPRPVRVLVSSIRAEPRTFNRYAARDSVVETLTHLLHARLVRVDRRTQELEPWLAKSWTRSDDGLTYTLALRDGVLFSDGAPFTSADVLFSFRAAYDENANAVGDGLRVAGQPLQVAAPDAHTVVVRFPAPFGPGIRLLDNLPILPRHKLEAALIGGTLLSAWGPSTPVAEIVGLGPFVLKEYQPGQRLVLGRNPHYWRTEGDSTRLPLLDRLTLEIVPDQNAELLRLQSGQIDFTQTEMRPEDYATLKGAAGANRLRLVDLGVGLDADSLWLNLRPGRSTARRAWLQRVELRRAISHAVNRKEFADIVYLGAAVPVYGPVTPANAAWYSASLPRFDYDPAAARRLLASIGLADRSADGVLEDRSGAPAEITLITQKGNTALERGAAFIREETAKVGLKVNVVALEVGTLIDRIERGDYEAVYFRFWIQDLDPALNTELWLSSGAIHVWNPSQRVPATDWERRIDELMRRQAASLDQAERKVLFDQVQAIFAEQQPILQFAAPRMIVAMSRRVENATPAVQRPAMILWNPDRLSVREGSSRP